MDFTNVRLYLSKFISLLQMFSKRKILLIKETLLTISCREKPLILKIYHLILLFN